MVPMGSVYREVIYYACKIKSFEVPLCIACAGAHYTVGGHNCPWASELVLMCPSKKRKRKTKQKVKQTNQI